MRCVAFGVQSVDDFIAKQPLDEADYRGMLGAVLEDYPGIIEIPTMELLLDFLVRCNFNLHNLGLLPLVAQLNHKCGFNLTLTACNETDQSPGMVTVEVRASCEIAADSELCISYLTDREASLPTAARMAVLRRWGFECNCSMCNVENSKQSVPEAKRPKA